MSHLLNDLVLQVPGENEDVGRLRRIDRRDRLYGNMHARREAAVLVRVAIHGEIEEIRTDPAIVQERVAFSGRSIPTDLLSFVLCRNQKRQQLALGARHLIRKRRIGRNVPVAKLFLQRE